MNLFKKIKSVFRKKKRANTDLSEQNIIKPKKSKPARPVNIVKPVTPVKDNVVKRKGLPNIESLDISEKKSTNTYKTVSHKPSVGSAKAPIHKLNVKLPSQIKLVITGSVGAGKTTAIYAVSDKPPVTTETKPTDDVLMMKDSTTTSMDYGSYWYSSATKVHVYGTPGQQRFSFMSDVLTKGAHGLIILINNNQDEPLEDLDYYLKHNEKFLLKSHAVIGITHLDVNRKHNIKMYTDFMQKQGIPWPVMPVDARKNSDILRLADKMIVTIFSPKFH